MGKENRHSLGFDERDLSVDTASKLLNEFVGMEGRTERSMVKVKWMVN